MKPTSGEGEPPTCEGETSAVGEEGRTPDECSELDQCEVEPLYYSLNGRNDRSRRGKAYRSRSDSEYRCFEAHDGVKYRPGDCVFIECSSTEPYLVASIVQFKMTKREQLSVKVTRFFRAEDVPEVSLSLILQERKEMDENHETSARELFSSDSSTFYPINALRGKCNVVFVKDIKSAANYDLSGEAAFFSCLSFNHESSRLASVQGEIRIGGSYQARLPPEATCSVSEEPDRDELLWRPGQIDYSVQEKYVKLTRTFRMLSMGEAKMSKVEHQARLGDILLDDAICTLHRCHYSVEEAVSQMNANDRLLSADSNFMTAEDTKKFGKGIKTYGKNFARISRELLPMHSRDQLVGFYYLWKKSNDATKPKALPRQRNVGANGWKRNKNGKDKSSRPASTELNDYASASETELEQNETEGRTREYACHHCYGTKSRDWHHAGRDPPLLLCTDCRLFYKMYGQFRPVDRPSTVPPCLFKRSPSGTDYEEESGVRTRAGKKERRRTPSADMERRSPNGAIDIDLERRRIGKRKKSQVNGGRKRAREESSGKDERDDESSREGEDVKEVKIEIKSEEPSEEPEEEVDLDEEPGTFEYSDEVVLTTKAAKFVRRIVRSGEQSCSRTDLMFTSNPDSDYEKGKQKRKLEKERKLAQQAQVFPHHAMQATIAPQPKKMDTSRVPMNGQPAFPLPPSALEQQRLLAAFASHQQQQHHQQQQQQQQQQQLEQQHQMMMMLARNGQAQAVAAAAAAAQQRDSPSRHAFGLVPPHSLFQQIPPDLMHQDPMRLQMEMLAAGHLPSAQQAASMMPHSSQADLHNLLLRSQVEQHPLMQMLQMQQLHMMGLPAGPGMPVPGLQAPNSLLGANSEMMRRLQQDGAGAFLPPR